MICSRAYGDADTEVDLGSYAFQIWKNAIDRDPSLQKTIADLPNVVYRLTVPREEQPEGVLVYVRTAEGNDAPAWVDKHGNPVTVAVCHSASCHVRARHTASAVTITTWYVIALPARKSPLVADPRFGTYERLDMPMRSRTLFDQQLRRA